jgi:hypothetical protein
LGRFTFRGNLGPRRSESAVTTNSNQGAVRWNFIVASAVSKICNERIESVRRRGPNETMIHLHDWRNVAVGETLSLF